MTNNNLGLSMLSIQSTLEYNLVNDNSHKEDNSKQ